MSKYGVMSVVTRNQFLAVFIKFGNSLLGKSMTLGNLRPSLSGFEDEKRRPRENGRGIKFEFSAGARFREESKLVDRALH